MKYRKSFVTNSSSSSYVCDFCGEVESGWDMCLSDAHMVQCVNGHTMCEHHCVDDFDLLEKCKTYIKNEIIKQQNYIKEQPSRSSCYMSIDDMLTEEEINELGYEALLEYSDNFDLSFRYSFPEELCVFCNLEDVPNDTVVRLLLKDNNITKSQLAALIKKRFDNNKNLQEYLRT